QGRVMLASSGRIEDETQIATPLCGRALGVAAGALPADDSKAKRSRLLGTLLKRRHCRYSQGRYDKRMMRDSPARVNARLVRSLRNQGVRYTFHAALRHVNTAFSRLLDRHFDIAFGTDTRGVIETGAQTDVTSPNLSRGIRYEPTRALPLQRVMRAA